MSDESIREFRHQYQAWYGSTLTLLPDDLKPQFIKEFENGKWTSGIEGFISAPTKPNVIFSKSAEENPETMSFMYWQFPIETTFEKRFFKQQALMRQARERYAAMPAELDRSKKEFIESKLKSPLGQPIESNPSEGEPDKQEEAFVFVAHGRSPLYLQVIHFLKDDLGLKPVSFETEDHSSEQISEVLNQYLDRAVLAVIVMTGEDATIDNRKLARQNVVHEAGLFQGKLGFEQVILLKEEGVEGFTNVQGLVYIPFNPQDITTSFHKLRNALSKRGLVPIGR
jgi:predicted nucleotide-binding protein